MRQRGFSLVEVLVALAMLGAVGVAFGHVVAVATTSFHSARVQGMTAVLAAARLEDLMALTWEVDAAGARVTDTTTDLSRQPPSSTGAGLSSSPPASLLDNTAGYADFLDAQGRWLSAGPTAPPRAAFVRRWGIRAPADGAADAVVLEVLVRPVAQDVPVNGRRPAVARGETRLVSLRTRLGQ